MTITRTVTPNVFMSVGEASGDLYAGFLARHIKAQNKNIKIYGVGGEDMRRAGVNIIMDYQQLMTFGFAATFQTLWRNYGIYRLIAHSLYRLRPKTFIAIAYPGINLLLCRYARHLNCQVSYFLPPQIWAWGSFRKYFISKWVNRVISIFPFEYEFYKKLGMDTVYFENPLLAILKNYTRNDPKKRIGFMPGSRPSEIARNLRVMIRLMKRIEQQKEDIEFVLILHSRSLNPAKKIIAQSKPSFSMGMITQDRYQAMKNCDLLVICSGTASLEAAFMHIPQIFFNRPCFFDYYFTRHFIRVKEYNLTNLYTGQKTVTSIVSRNIPYILQNLINAVEKTFAGGK